VGAVAEEENVYLVRLVLVEHNSDAGPFFYRSAELPERGDVIEVESRAFLDARRRARVTQVLPDEVLPIRAVEHGIGPGAQSAYPDVEPNRQFGSPPLLLPRVPD
jgi:hypothetical protein